MADRKLDPDVAPVLRGVPSPSNSIDPAELLAVRPLTAYRLISARYANLSGVGAAQFPGRWNRPGQPAIYTSLHPSTAILEKRVHAKGAIPSNLVLMKVAILGSWENQGAYLLEGKSSAMIFIYPSLAHATGAFLETPPLFGGGTDPIAVAVPSVISPAWNLVLYPDAQGFWEHVSVVSIKPFEFDPRLFHDEAAIG